jgi:high-affinity Fe2+/Pb2+ permease
VVSDRLTKEELKEDRVLAAATQAVEYARKNARWVVAAVAVAVVATVAAIVVIQGRVKSERQASLLLLTARAESSATW